MNEETRVIFLDVDGVLNSNPEMKKYNCYTYEPYVKNLKRIYDKYPDTKIVLSSTWKNIEDDNYVKSSILNTLNKYGIEIFDTIPDIYSDTGEFILSRPAAIVEWLNLHPEINYWVSIEDDCNEEMYKKADPYCHVHLCKTEWGWGDESIEDCGLNLIKTHVALEILGGKYD